jgi:hypothetical protein
MVEPLPAMVYAILAHEVAEIFIIVAQAKHVPY